MSPSALARRPSTFGLLALGLLVPATSPAEMGDPSAGSFREVLVETTRTQMRAVAAYIAEHPEADDADEARSWLFGTAMSRGLQNEAAKAAEDFLATEAPDDELARTARMVRAISRVRGTKYSAAIEDFREVLNGTRLRAPDSTVVFAEQLAVELQLAGQTDLAKEVFDELARRFAILPELRRRMEGRLEKLRLVGESPPTIGLNTLDGTVIDLPALKGKVVIVDFWATNCRPCLEMLPLLRRLHARYGERDLVVIGVSLDDAPGTVQTFAARERLAWSLAMDDGEVSNAYHVRTIPSLFVVGRDGRVAYVDVRDESLERAVRKLVAEGGAKGTP